MAQKKKKGSGGKRPGAGRPKTTAGNLNMRLSIEAAAKIGEVKKRDIEVTDFVNKAIIEKEL